MNSETWIRATRFALIPLVVAIWTGLPGSPSRTGPTAMGARATLGPAETYGMLPLAFEPNVGQTDRRVDFLARGSGYTAFLTSGEPVLSLRGRANLRSVTARPDREQATAAVVRMHLVGRNPHPVASGIGRLPGTVNYFTGNDPAAWRTGIPTYGEVTYREVYPEIDLTYYGNQQRLEFDFILAPGADPDTIRLRFAGADVAVDSRGGLVLGTRGGEVRIEKPRLYQEISGLRREVPGGYGALEAGTIGFRVGSYDPTRSLIIDPILVYSTFLGGSAGDGASDIAVDSDGRAYIAGYTSSTDFPTANASDPSPNGGGDAFVTKLSPLGTAAEYSTYLGGGNDDGANGVALDAAGNAYVAGGTRSTNFPITAGAADPTCGGCAPYPYPGDAFVTKLDGTGAIAYSTFVGGYDYEHGYGLAADSAGNAYVTGGIANGNATCSFPVVNAYQSCARSYYDTFVTKVNPGGTAFLYSTVLGGNNDEYCGCDIEVDGAGNAYMTGISRSVSFPTTAGALDSTCGTSFQQHVGIFDAMAVKIDTNAAGGASLAYSTCVGGSGNDGGSGIGIDGAGNIWLTGSTPSTDFPTVNAYDDSANGGGDTFIVGLNPSATGSAQLLYGSYLGGSAGDGGGDVAVDAGGNVYVVGSTASADFPIFNAIQLLHRGASDVFVTKLNPAFSGVAQLLLGFSTYLGGCNDDGGGRLALDPLGGVYISGGTSSATFPTTIGSYQGTYGGNGDGFVARILGAGPGVPAPGALPVPACE